MPEIRVHMHGSHFVRLAIPARTGRLELAAEGPVALHLDAQQPLHLGQAVTLPWHPRPPPGVRSHEPRSTLQRVRASTILDEVDSRAAYLGYTTARRLPLRRTDLAKFGSSTRSVLFVRLPRLPLHYLVLVLDETGFRFALIAVREGGEFGQPLLAVEEVGWLDRNRLGAWRTAEDEGKGKAAERVAADPFGFDVTIEDLKALRLYCTHRIASFRVEQQLHARRIRFRTVAPAAGVGRAAAALPYLVVQSEDLLHGQIGRQVAYPNVAIQSGILADEDEDIIRVSLARTVPRSTIADTHSVANPPRPPFKSGSTTSPSFHQIPPSSHPACPSTARPGSSASRPTTWTARWPASCPRLGWSCGRSSWRDTARALRRRRRGRRRRRSRRSSWRR